MGGRVCAGKMPHAGCNAKDGGLFAGLGYSESKVRAPEKQREGYWTPVGKPGPCGVPPMAWLDTSVRRRKRPEPPADLRHVDMTEALEPAEEEFHHSGWNVRRRRVMEGMVAAQLSPAVVSRFKNCGSRAWVWRNKHDGRVAVRADYCRSRFCVRCAGRVAARARASISNLAEGTECRLVTLTIPHVRSDALAVLIDRLLESFKALRRDEAWSSRVKGGAFVLEIKYNHNGGGWHPHLHIVCDASFLPVKQLQYAWERVAGGGDFNVKRVWAERGVASYVAKYVTKAFDGSVFHHPDKVVECIKALRGRRTISTFGGWRGVDLLGEAEAFEADAWKPLCRLTDVLTLAADGAPHALRVLRLLAEKGSALEPDPPPD